jgi:hypothetical protein
MPGSLEIINANSRTAQLQGQGLAFFKYVYMKGACVSTPLFIEHVAIGILQFNLEIFILNVMFSDSSYIPRQPYPQSRCASNFTDFKIQEATLDIRAYLGYYFRLNKIGGYFRR